MMRRGMLVAAFVALGLCGCSREQSLNCESSERYASARSVPPVRVPEGLTVPNETDSLRLPPEPVVQGNTAEGCLESPPDFFENRRPSAPEVAQPSEQPGAAEDPERQISN
jgi:uncharacterized lipoprotein